MYKKVDKRYLVHYFAFWRRNSNSPASILVFFQREEVPLAPWIYE